MKATFLLLVENNAGYNGWFNWKQCNAGWILTVNNAWQILSRCCAIVLSSIDGSTIALLFNNGPSFICLDIGRCTNIVHRDCNKDRREQIQDIHQIFKRFWFHSLSKVLLLTCVTKCFYQMFLPNVYQMFLPNVFPIVLPSDFTKWQFESPCESYLDHSSVNKIVSEFLKTF